MSRDHEPHYPDSDCFMKHSAIYPSLRLSAYSCSTSTSTTWYPCGRCAANLQSMATKGLIFKSSSPTQNSTPSFRVPWQLSTSAKTCRPHSFPVVCLTNPMTMHSRKHFPEGPSKSHLGGTIPCLWWIPTSTRQPSSSRMPSRCSLPTSPSRRRHS